MEIILKIDLREKYIIEKIKTHNESLFKFKIEYTQLDLGDFIFYVNSPNVSKMLCIIERKEIKDLISSLKDNRYKEQKSRLLRLKALQPDLHVYYIIENYGSFNNSLPNVNNILSNVKHILPNSKNALTENHIYPVFTNTMFRDSIPIYHTSNVEETVKFLLYLGNSIVKCYPEMILAGSEKVLTFNKVLAESEKVLTFDKVLASNNGSIEPNSVLPEPIFSLKKPKIQPKEFYKNVLLLIPGIQEKTANSIMGVYKNLTDLLIMYQDLSEPECMDLLSSVKIISGDKSRKLGHSISAKVYEFMKVL